MGWLVVLHGKGRSMTGTGRPSDWSEEEFRVLQEHPTRSDEALAAMLPGRTAGAVGVARAFVDGHSSGGTVSRLSKVRLRVLEGRWDVDDQPEPAA